MRRLLIALTAPAALVGCAGLEIETLTPEQVAQARTSPGNALKGYVVYEPLVVVDISVKEVCLAGKAGDNCKAALVEQCTASIPFSLPDYSKPYLVRSKNGFGKAGVDIAIGDGWRLGSIKDSSDNTAVLSTVEKLLGLASTNAGSKGPRCPQPGLYRVSTDKGGFSLSPINLGVESDASKDGLK